MKISITLTASAAVIGQVLTLLADEGILDEMPLGSVEVAQPTPAPMVVDTQLVHEAVAAAGGIELDGSGLPWDERIHAATKTKKADGTWTRRKRLADGVYESVEAELRARYPMTGTPTPPPTQTVQPAAPVVVAAPQPSEVPNVTVPTAPVPAGSFPGAPAFPNLAAAPTMPVPTAPVEVAPQPAPAPVTPAAPVQPAGPPTNLHELMAVLGPLTAQGQVTPDYLGGVIAEANTAWAAHLNGGTLNSLADIAAYPALSIPQWIYQVFQRDGKVA